MANQSKAIPSDLTAGLVHGLELVKQFTTVDEPKLKDFPSDKYKLYWEILLNTVIDGYTAMVRFYSYTYGAGPGGPEEVPGGKTHDVLLAATDIPSLKEQVNKVILATMAANKKE